MSEVIVSWSGGKDSCLAAYRAAASGHTIKYLFNTVSAEYSRVRFHGVEDTVVQKQAEAVGIPLVQKSTNGESYEQEFEAGLRSLSYRGVHGAVFGDIHLRHCREWAEGICRRVGLEAIGPLWGLSPHDVLGEFIEAGFEALVVSTQADKLGRESCGRRLDSAFLEDGEYHTLVTDGPLFKKRIDITEVGKVLRDGYWFLDIRRYALSDRVNAGVSQPMSPVVGGKTCRTFC